MSDFQLDTKAKLKNVNPRKEGPKDDQVLALDLKFETVCEGEIAADVLGDQQYSRIREFLWRHGEDGEIRPRFSNLDRLKSERELPQMNVTVAGIWLAGAKVHKFGLVPEAGEKVELTFQVSVVDPPSNALPILADLLDQDLEVAIEPAQQELALNGQNGQKEPVE